MLARRLARRLHGHCRQRWLSGLGHDRSPAVRPDAPRYHDAWYQRPDVLKTVRQRYAAADLPVIMATAKDQSEDIVTALQLGANDYVTKPLDFPVVLARTQTQLSLKRAMQEIQRLAAQLSYVTGLFARLLDATSPTTWSPVCWSAEGLQLGGEKRRVTILISDLRGFTSSRRGWRRNRSWPCSIAIWVLRSRSSCSTRARLMRSLAMRCYHLWCPYLAL